MDYKYKSYYLYEYDLTLEQLVLFTHHFDTFDEYIKNYKVYCADKKKINSICKFDFIDNVKSKNIDQNDNELILPLNSSFTSKTMSSD